MLSVNKVIIIGNVTKDPELKALPSGAKVTSLSVATNRKYKAQDGSYKEEGEFHNVVVYGGQAEATAMYMKKGSQIMIEGRIATRTWDAQDGTKKYRTEIVAENVQFGSKPATQAAPEKTFDEKVKDLDSVDYPDEEINLEDIPF